MKKDNLKFRAWGKFGYAEDEEKPHMVYDWEDTDYLEYLDFDGEKAFEVMQAVGFADINGKEIFEGDVVYIETADEIPVITAQVVWCHYKWCLRNETTEDDVWRYFGYSNSIVKVIGNVFENPNLRIEDKPYYARVIDYLWDSEEEVH